VLDFQRFYACLTVWWMGQGWGAKQGIRWLGLVFGLVLSKGVKFGVKFNKQGLSACLVLCGC
jgi:hypothetical protein